MRRTVLVPVLAALLVAGCVGGSSSLSEKDRAAFKPYILDAAPADVGTRLDVEFDGKVTLLGARVEPAGKDATPPKPGASSLTAKPGERVKLTLYWRSNQKLGDGWNLFTHVIDGSGERVLNIDNVGPLREWKETRQALPPSAWEPGKVYVDEQTFEVPRNLKSPKLSVVTGIWSSASRLKITSGPKDGDNRALVTSLEVTGGAKEAPRPVPRVPMLRIDRLDAKVAKPKLDGKLDDEAWKAAPSAGPFVDVATGLPNTTFPVNGAVRVLWSDEGLYLAFDVKDANVVGGFPKDAKDPHLWTKDTVEIMVDPDGDGDNKDYYEIQINPQGLVFDSQFDDYNLPKQEPDGPFGHQEWSSEAKVGVVVDGTIDKSDDKDVGYVVEAFLPWSAFGKAKQRPPKLGDVWRVNFYAMENNGGVAWSAILRQGNFHKATRFGKLLFAEAGWVPPSEAPPPAASASAGASAAPSASGPPPTRMAPPRLGIPRPVIPQVFPKPP